MTQEVAQERVTFYSWLGSDEKGRKIPSSQVIYIGGGLKRVANDGQTVQTPAVHARFQNGHLETDDPEVIAGLRLMIKKHPGCGVTEDREEYYDATMTEAQKSRRSEALKSDNTVLAQENERLKRLLEQKGSEEMPKRRAS